MYLTSLLVVPLYPYFGIILILCDKSKWQLFYLLHTQITFRIPWLSIEIVLVL